MSLFPAYSQGGEEEEQATAPWEASFSSFPSEVVLSPEKVPSTTDFPIPDLPQITPGSSAISECLDKRIIERKSAEKASERHERRRRHRKRKSEDKEERKQEKRKKREKERRSKTKDNSKIDVAISRGQVYAKFNKKLVFSDKSGLQPEEAFRVDLQADRNNLLFDRTQSNITPRYRPTLRYRVLGESLASPSKSKRRPDRYFTHQRFVSRDDIEKVPSAIEMGELPFFIEDNPIVAERTAANPLGLYDPATASYISGTKPVTAKPKSEVEDEETIVRKQVRDYNRKLAKIPKDVSLWVKYVDFQDTAVIFEFESEKRHRANTTLVSEKKLSILERAIKELPNSIELTVKRLHIGENIWTNEELRLQWLDALKVHPASCELWNAYLDFMEHFGDFKVGDVLGGYRRCFLKLISLLLTLAGKRKEDLEMGLRDIFFRLCIFLKSTGYLEKAVALYQMQLELAVRTDPALRKEQRFSVLLEMCDRFWDSHVPRLGEIGSKPWNSVLENPEQRNRRKTSGSSDESEILKCSAPKVEKWLGIEVQRERTQWLPWTPTEEEDEVDDKDRYVAIEDLKPYLFQVSNPACAVSLVLDFLRLLGCLDPTEYTLTSSTALELIVDQKVPPILQSADYDVTKDLLIGGSDAPIVTFAHNVISQCFQFLGVPEQVLLLNFWLDFECCKVKFMKKSSEQFASYWKYLKKKLKMFMGVEELRNNISVFTKYIVLCDVAGESDSALRFFATLFSCQEKSLFDTGDVTSKVLLLNSLLVNTRMLLNKHENKEIPKEMVISPLVQAFCEENFAENRIPGAASILRARNRSLAILSDFTEEEDAEVTKYQTLWCCCCLYLTFFSHGFSAALELGKNFVSKMEGLDVKLKELIHTTLLTLGTFAVKSQYSGSFALHSEFLLASVIGYPESLDVISFFLEYQKISQGAKRLFDGALKVVAEDARPSCQNLVLAIAVTYAYRHENFVESEAELWKEIGAIAPLIPDGLKHKIKNFFEVKMTDRRCRQNILLWRTYLTFLYHSGFNRELKSISYQVMQCCPFSKDVLLDIIRFIPGCLNDICKLMSDKDMRVRIPVEELDLLLEDL